MSLYPKQILISTVLVFIMSIGHLKYPLFCRLQRESQPIKIKNFKKKIDTPESILRKAKWTWNYNTWATVEGPKAGGAGKEKTKETQSWSHGPPQAVMWRRGDADCL